MTKTEPKPNGSGRWMRYYVVVNVHPTDDSLDEISEIRIRTARKQHVCKHCARPIGAGERYLESFNHGASTDWDRYRYHLDCARQQGLLKEEHDRTRNR